MTLDLTPASWLEVAEAAAAPRADMLAAIVAGDRTKQQLATRFGITLHPVLGISLALSAVLDKLVCDGLVNMRVVDRQWHYLPSSKGRTLAAAAVTAR